MNLIRRSLVGLMLVAVATSGAWAQDKGDKKKKKGAQRPQPIAQLEKQLEGLGLSDEQNAKVKSIIKEHEGKILAAQQKANDVLTPEQRKARAEAGQKAKGEGKKGKDLAEAVSSAVNLTPEQKAKSEEATKGVRDAVDGMRKAVLETLTPDQRAKLGGEGKKKKKNA